jgi:cardiolipin synthase
MREATRAPLRSWIIGLASVALLLAGCSAGDLGSTSSAGGTSNPLPTLTGAPSTTCTAGSSAAGCALGSGVQNVSLFVEPDAGAKPLVDAIKNAQHSVWLEMYLLTDSSVINALEDAAGRGLDVRVMLEPKNSPDQTIARLNAAGVKAQETNPAFDANGGGYGYTHAKVMIVDDQVAYISSANYTLSALGGSSSTTDRDYIVEDHEAADVSECAAIFTADWNRVSPSLPDPNLIVSPINARVKLLALIQSAHTSLHLEEEEMSDPAIIQALSAAAGRGVSVEVVVPQSNNASDVQGEQQLTQAGVKVTAIDSSVGNNLYIHAKIIIADDTLAFVGSENVSTNSLDDNREVGVLVANSQAIQQLEQTFEIDFQTVASS